MSQFIPTWKVLAKVAPKSKLCPSFSADIFDRIELMTCSRSKRTFLDATRHPKGPMVSRHCSTVSKMQLGWQLKLQLERITESSLSDSETAEYRERGHDNSYTRHFVHTTSRTKTKTRHFVQFILYNLLL